MRTTTRIQRLLWLLAIIFTVVLIDQWSKRLMVDWIGPAADGHRVELLGSFVAFEYLENRGASFGFFQQGTLLLAIVSVLIISAGMVMMVRFADHFSLAAAIALLLGGAIGNAIDRFARGFVVDFIAIGRFWKFNLADSAITIGVLLALYLTWRADHASSPSPAQDQHA